MEPPQNAEAGPSRPPPRLRNIEKTYTGPDPATLDAPRSRTQADKYFARVANENVLPTRLHKALGIGGWVLGGFACAYMALYADFGDREHVFSPLRRKFHSFTHDLFTLSPSERVTMGLDPPSQLPPAPDQAPSSTFSRPLKGPS